jgi:HSP20 family molecular chaperone IbpA
MITETPPAGLPAVSRLMDDDPIFAKMQEVYLTIVRRAYDLFKESEFSSREDLEEWRLTVSDLLQQLPLAVNETDDEISICAEVPGYGESDLEVKVDTNRIFISGSTELPSECEGEKDEALCAERSSKEFVREYLLPTPIDPEKVSAELRDGVLEIHLTKCEHGIRLLAAGEAA